MRYSKIITEYCNTYRISAPDAFFVILVAHGCSRAEAYGCAFNCSSLQESTLKNRASALFREKPGVAKLHADLIQRSYKAPEVPPDWATYNAKSRGVLYKGTKSVPPSEGDGWDDSESTAANLERIIRGELPRMAGKEKLDAAIKYGKLKGFNPDVVETTHYYMPLACHICSLFKAHKEG